MQDVITRFSEAVSTGVDDMVTLEAYRKDGSIVYVEASTRKVELETGAKRFLVVLRDVTAHKQAEDALRESEAQYRLLADNLTDVIWTRDLELKLTYISPSVMQQSGFSVEEKMTQPLKEKMTPDSVATSIRILGEELALEREGTRDLERSRTFQLEMYRKDGSTYPVESTVSFLRDNSGKATGIIGVNRDITERKRTEETLHHIQKAVESSNEAIGMSDSKGNHFYQNKSFTELFGYTAEELAASYYVESQGLLSDFQWHLLYRY